MKTDTAQIEEQVAVRAGFPCVEVPQDGDRARQVGLYPQVQEGLWMQRVKILGGFLSSHQWKSLGRLAEQFTGRTPLHLTTRQDVEFHNLTSEQVPGIQQGLADIGLTSIGACGDTLRNITVCPCSGVLSGSVGLSDLAWQIRRELETWDEIFSLPRKFKISLSCCSERTAQPWINDLGFIAAYKDGQWGFEVVGAGSLGARPGTGIVLFNWLPAADVLPCVAGAVQLFAQHGDRKNRTKARLRHIRERFGDETFTQMLHDAYELAKHERSWPEVQLRETVDGYDKRVVLTFANGDVNSESAEAIGVLAQREDIQIRIANNHRVIVFGRNEAKLRTLVVKRH